MDSNKPISWEEALKLNGKPGYTPKDALSDREKALASLPGARSAADRRWVAISEESRSCDRHGAYTARLEELQPPTPLNKPFWTQCPMCDSEIADEQRIQSVSDIEMRKTIERMRMIHAGIPERNMESDFWNYQHRIPAMDKVWRQLRDYADHMEEAIEVGRCAVLFGLFGTGKTHLACAILRHVLLKLGGTALYTTQGRFISMLKAAMSKDSKDAEQQVFERLGKVDVLVIDEIGRGGTSQWERSSLFRLLDERYQQRCKPTILVTNLPIADLTQEIDQAGVDRLKENGGIKVHFNWESQRVAKPQPAP